MKRVSGEESARRWELLAKRALPSDNGGSGRPPAPAQDPFDCSDLVVPTSQVLVEREIKIGSKQWKDLEKRKVHSIVDEPSSSLLPEVEKDTLSGNKRSRNDEQRKNRTGGWHANRLRLPENFDYATREPHPPNDDGSTGDRVLSLDDPSVHLSLEQELWKIFRAVPTAEQIEARAMEGAGCRHMRALHKEMADGLKNHGRMDCHALSRLRMRDCHGLPETTRNASNLNWTTTIRMEFWRRQMKRGHSPDANRMELEFLGSQTLKDVHDVIVELSNDELWDESEPATTSDANTETSGIFFIENTFFTTGSVDYTSSITAWLDGTNTFGTPRRIFLGLPLSEPLKLRSMVSARLDQLRWRLGVRYLHCHHGDVECSVFLTDVRQRPLLVSDKTSFPIIHDVWTPPYPSTDCEACHHRVGVLCVSSDNKVTDGGPRALCESCHKQLYPMNDSQSPANVIKYSVWRDQVDLSVGHQEPRERF